MLLGRSSQSTLTAAGASERNLIGRATWSHTTYLLIKSRSQMIRSRSYTDATCANAMGAGQVTAVLACLLLRTCQPMSAWARGWWLRSHPRVALAAPVCALGGACTYSGDSVVRLINSRHIGLGARQTQVCFRESEEGVERPTTARNTARVGSEGRTPAVIAI